MNDFVRLSECSIGLYMFASGGLPRFTHIVLIMALGSYMSVLARLQRLIHRRGCLITIQPEHKVHRRLSSDVVFTEQMPVLQLHTGKDQALLLRRDAFLVIDFPLRTSHAGYCEVQARARSELGTWE